MPNWVFAGFNVTGDRAELARFKGLLIKPRWKVGPKGYWDIPSPSRSARIDPESEEGQKLTIDFDGIIPMPPVEDCPNWERWAVENWGTKWNACSVDVKIEDPDRIWFQFQTPWSFPDPVFEALAEEFPSLVFSGSAYEESGEFELVGEFNGENDWGPGKIEWLEFGSDGEGEGGIQPDACEHDTRSETSLAQPDPPVIDNRLPPADAAAAAEILRSAFQVLAAGPVRATAINPAAPPFGVGHRFDANGVVLLCGSGTMEIIVDKAASGGRGAGFTLVEFSGYRTETLPTSFAEALARIGRWISDVETSTPKEVIAGHDDGMDEAMEAATAAASAAHPGWEFLLIEARPTGAVELEVTHCDGPPVRYSTEASAGEMSPPLAEAVRRYRYLSTIQSGCRPGSPGLHICLWHPFPGTSDRVLSPEEKAEAAQFAKQKGYSLVPPGR